MVYDFDRILGLFARRSFLPESGAIHSFSGWL